MDNDIVFETLPFGAGAEREDEGDLEAEVRRGGMAGRGRPPVLVRSGGARRPWGSTGPWTSTRPWVVAPPWTRPWPRRPWVDGGVYAVPAAVTYDGYALAGVPMAYPGAQQPTSDRVRWVQEALNQALGLHLRADGVIRRSLREAIRSFQQRSGLRPTGRFGPRTRQALVAAVSGGGAGGTAGETGEAETLDEGTYEGEDEVIALSGPGAECSAALKRAGKTEAQALAIINTQIARAVRMLRRAAAALAQGKRSKATSDLFVKIFRVRPDFVPKWLKPTAQVRDRGDVVAVRCQRVADLLAGGGIRFFCSINGTHCPDCAGTSAAAFACSSWGDDSAAPKNSLVVCLGTSFWDAMRSGDLTSVLATLLHEPFHIYFGRYVTEHRTKAGKFGGIYCIQQFVFQVNGSTGPKLFNERCAASAARA
jgi:hypothetical protein